MPPELVKRAAWIVVGGLLLGLALLTPARQMPVSNLAIPAAAWMILRGLT